MNRSTIKPTLSYLITLVEEFEEATRAVALRGALRPTDKETARSEHVLSKHALMTALTALVQE